MAPSDRELMQRLAGGDREALAPLMERHSRRVYRIALSYLRDPDDALDAVQDTFVKAFQAAARWDTSTEVAPWLMRIAVNHSIDRYRRGKRRGAHHTPLVDGDHDERIAADEASPERRAHGRELGEKALGNLIFLVLFLRLLWDPAESFPTMLLAGLITITLRNIFYLIFSIALLKEHRELPLKTIWGTRDAIARPSVEARLDVLRRHHPELDARLIEGAGHWVMYEAPDAFCAALLELLGA